MIVSPGRRYVFVHAPKTGGTAMALALESKAMKDDIMAGDTPKAKARAGRLKGLGTARRLSKHSMLSDLDGYLSPQDLAEYYIFMLVRNPWDRMVSYYQWLQAQSFSHPAITLAKSLNFPGFVAHPQTAASMSASHYARYVTDCTGVEQCNLFIRLEQLQGDLAVLENRLGFALKMPHANPSHRKADYQDYYVDKTRDAVAVMSAVDIARFGYTFK